MSMSLKIAHSSVTLTSANTEYEFPISPKTRQIQFRSRTSSHVIRWSTRSGVVAGGGGMPIEELEAQVIGSEDGPNLQQGTIYVASATAGAIVEIATLSEVSER